MIKRILLAVAAAAALLAFTAAPALADEKFLGTVTKIEMAGAAANVTLKDDAGATVTLVVEDKVTLDKFGDKRINVGDEIKAKYQVKGGKKVSTFFKKPGGC
jgi:hypothetical protein